MKRLLNAMAEIPPKALRIPPIVLKDDQGINPDHAAPDGSPAEQTSSSVLVDVEGDL